MAAPNPEEEALLQEVEYLPVVAPRSVEERSPQEEALPPVGQAWGPYLGAGHWEVSADEQESAPVVALAESPLPEED